MADTTTARTWARWTIRLAAALVGVAVLAAVAIHTPPVRRYALDRAVRTLAESYPFRLRADSLDYNVFALRVTLWGVELSAPHTPAQPFFTARRVTITIPRSAVWGPFSIEDVTIDDGRARVRAFANGTSNLPASSDAGGKPAPFRLHTLRAPRFAVDYSDESTGLALSLPWIDVSLAQGVGALQLQRPGRFARGEVSTTIHDLRGPLGFDGRVLSVPALVVRTEEIAATVDGRVEMFVDEPALDVRVKGRGDLSRLAEWGGVASPPRGQVDFSADLDGPLSRLQATAELRSAQVDTSGVRLTDVAAAVAATPDGLRVRSLETTLAGGRVRASADVPFGTSDVRVEAMWTNVDVGTLLALSAPEIRPRPSGRFDGSLTGHGPHTDLDRWVVAADARVHEGTTPGIRMFGTTRARLERSRWNIDATAEVERVPLRATLRGRIDSTRLPRSTVNGTITLLQVGVPELVDLAKEAGFVTGEIPAIEGTVEGVATIAGTIQHVVVTAEGNGHLADLAAVAPGTPLTGPAAIQFDADRAQVRFTAQANDLDATVRAVIVPSAPYQAVVDVEAPAIDLERLLRGLDTPIPIVGTASATAHATGSLQDWQHGRATLELAAVDARAGALPLRLAAPARIEYDGTTIAVASFEMRAGDLHASAAGSLPVRAGVEPVAAVDALRITIAGDLERVRRAVDATGLLGLPDVTATGPAALLARVTGSAERPIVDADLELGPGTLQLAGLPAVTGVQVQAHANGEWIELRGLQGEWQGSRINATARVPVEWAGLDTGRASTPNATLDARIASITPAVLAPFLDAETLAQVEGSLDLSAVVQGAAPTLDALAGEVRLDRMDVRIAGLPVAQRVPTRIAVADGVARVAAWEWTGQGGEVSVAGQVRLADTQAALIANGRVDLRMLTPFVRAAGMTTAGTLEPRVSITGTLDNPRVDGVADIRDGEIRLREPRMIATDLAARAHVTRTSAHVTDLAGTLNGGALEGSGSVEFAPRSPIVGTVSLVANGVAMEVPEGLRSELDADLGIAVTIPAADVVEPSGSVTGSVTVVRSAYREPIALVAGLLRAMRTRQAVAEGTPEPSLADNLRLDVRVLTDEDLLVDNNLGRLQLGTDLRVLGTVAAPSLAGRAQVREGGRLFFGRNIYVIESGTIDFANPALIEPDVSIRARTRAGGEDIVLTLEGTPDNLESNLESPSSDYGQADLASILLTGRPLDEVSGREGEIVREQVLGYLSGDVLGLASRAVGLDTIRLGGVDQAVLRRDPTDIATEVDPTTRLTFGKSLGRDFDVTYSQDLRDADAQAWIVEYRPLQNVELRLVSDDDDLRSYEFRHDVTFGGATVRRSPQARAPVPVRRERKVSAVELRGALVLPERTVRRELVLEEGDDFDFVEWQRDRERLEQLYRREGYDEARVDVDRNDTAAGMALIYTISPGPRTVLEVTGYELTADTRASVRAAWQQSVFDGFLVDEVSGIVREALARDGYPNARVESSIGLDAGVKTLVVAIEPGERGDVAGAPAAPVLPMAEVRLVGVSRLSTEDVYAATGLVAGAPFDADAVERARQRVLALYRRDGFPRARVDVQQTPRHDPPGVLVTFLVQEGPRQVITAVDVEGNRGIDRDVITRALALPIDEPVPADAWLEARRRVFDTGLFRRVDVTAEPIGPTPPDAETQAVRAHVTVEEWPAVRLRYGFEIAEERPEGEVEGRDLSPGLSADLTRRTLFGRAVTVGAALEYQRRERAGRAFLNAPTWFGWPVESSLLLERGREEFTGATLVTDTSGFSWEQRMRFVRNLRLSYAYRFERNHTFDTNPDEDFPFDLTVRVARLTATAAYDTRDDPSNATRGVLLTSSFDYAPAALGTEFRYVKNLAQAYVFTPWRGVVFASAARVGVAVALEEQELLFSERFFAGGSRTIRGAREDAVGRRDAFGEGRGGAALLLVNQEVRFPIYRWVGGVGFVDGGNVFETASDLDVGNLTGSIGFGFRINTPFALLRVDYGRLLSPGATERPGRWMFGIGQAF